MRVSSIIGLLLTLAATLLIDVGAAQAVEPLPSGDFDYQLGGARGVPESVAIVVRDRTVRPAAGKYNVCYVNGFQTQPDARRYWLRHRNLLAQKNNRLIIDGQWGEWLFDTSTPAKRARLMRIVGPWIDGCARDGFDAVEFDNLDSFTRSSSTLTRRNNLAFAEALVRRAHRNDLAAGQKNLAGYDGRRIGFDFAVAEECGRYNECGQYVRRFGSQVLMVEYRDQDFARTCSQYGSSHAVVRRDLALSPRYTPRYC